MNIASISDLYKQYGIPERTIYGWYERKLIKGQKIGKAIAIDVGSFKKYLSKTKHKGEI